MERYSVVVAQLFAVQFALYIFVHNFLPECVKVAERCGIQQQSSQTVIEIVFREERQTRMIQKQMNQNMVMKTTPHQVYPQ